MARLFLVAASVSFVLLAGSLVTGQLVRLPVPGQGGGLLVSDMAVGVVLVVAYGAILTKQVPYSFHATALLLLTTPFLVWASVGLVINSYALPFWAGAIGAAYLLRLAAYLLLIPALAFLAQEARLRRWIVSSFVGATIALLILGFGQLLFLPRLTELPKWLSGWDPHLFRLVSTWLDPNFMGLGFLLLGIFSVAVVKHPTVRIALGVATGLAIIFTGSRSSLVAMVAVFLLAGAGLGRRYALAIGSGVCAILGAGWLVLGHRAIALFGDDPTVSLRLDSLRTAWRLAEHYLWLGVGYNLYQFHTGSGSFLIHSRAGTDNSLLTLWVTTGIVGVMLFLLPWAYGVQVAWRQWIRRRSLTAGALLVSSMALFIHSQFINSWLYGHVLLLMAVSMALALSEPDVT